MTNRSRKASEVERQILLAVFCIALMVVACVAGVASCYAFMPGIIAGAGLVVYLGSVANKLKGGKG